MGHNAHTHSPGKGSVVHLPHHHHQTTLATFAKLNDVTSSASNTLLQTQGKTQKSKLLSSAH